MIFELAFMPSILMYSDDKEKFMELMDEELISSFMRKFFMLHLV
jgi:hypothetical protein